MMIRSLCAVGALGVGMTSAPTFAVVAFQSDFSKLADGNLVGQGGWTQFGLTSVNPIQVVSGRAVLPALPVNSSDRQDAQHTFTAISSTPGGSVYAGLTFNLSTVAAPNTSTTGSSFFNALATTDVTPFANLRVAARQGTAPGTFQLGIRTTGQGGNSFAFGGDLQLNTDLNLLLAWDFVAGTSNDTIAAWINPTSGVRGLNPTYATATNAATDPLGFQALVLSQFTSSTVTQSGVTFGRATVATEFSEVQSFIPTPATAALMALAGLCAARRRRV